MIDITPSDINSVRDLHLPPFTEKQNLRNHYLDGLSAAPREDIVRLHASNGSIRRQFVIPHAFETTVLCCRSLTLCTCGKPDSESQLDHTLCHCSRTHARVRRIRRRGDDIIRGVIALRPDN